MFRPQTLALLFAVACLSGCASKPPPELIGVWSKTDVDPIMRTTQTLKLNANGRFKVTHQRVVTANFPGSNAMGGPSEMTGGPVDANGVETLQSGQYTVKNGGITFTTLHYWVAGVDVGPTTSVSHANYTVSGNTLTLDSAAVAIVPTMPNPMSSTPQPVTTGLVLTKTQ